MNSTKLLFITSEFPPQPGGIGNHAYNLALALQKETKQISILTDCRSQNGIPEKVFDDQLPFLVQRVKRRKLLAITYFDRFFKAMKQIKRVDTVLVSGKFSLWLFFFLQLFYNKKYIAVIHGSEVLLSNKILRKFTHICLKKLDSVIAVSNYTKSLVNKLSLKSVVVIPNGFTIPENQILNFDHENPPVLKLITVGNITQRKGQHNVLKTIPVLLKKFPNLQYHIVGIPTEKEKIEKLATKLEITKHIIFHGKVSEEKKWELLKSSSIFMMLSEATKSGDVEGFGIAVLEANAVGLPAIGSKNCGIEDAIAHGRSGVLVDAHDPDMIFDAVEEINNSHTEFSKNATVWSKNFSWNIIVKQYLEVLTT